MEIKFACEGNDDTLIIQVLGHLHWDINYLAVYCRVNVSSFHGEVTGEIQASELKIFYNQLQDFYEMLKGQVIFETLEHSIRIEFNAGTLGQITLSGLLKDDYLGENRLSFVIAMDQTFLSKSIKELKKVIEKFPLDGRIN